MAKIVANKKILMVTLMTLLMSSVSFLGFSNTASADSALYRIYSSNYGDWDGVYVEWDPVGELATMDVRVKQYGIHSGERADIIWKLIRTSTGATVASERVTGDYDGYVSFYGIYKGDYQLIWQSLTSHDSEGYYGLPSAYANTYQ